MYKKSWLIPIIVLLFCSLILFFYQKSTNLNTYAAPLTPTSIDLHKIPSDIVELTVKWPTHTITTKRDGSSWILMSPTTTTADGSYIYDIIQAFISPGNIHLLKEHIENPSDYGISDHSTHMTLYDANGDVYELIQGNTLNATYYYGYNPQTNSLYGVPKKAFDMLSKDLAKWYDKNYIQFNPSTTKEITISFGDTVHSITPIMLHGELRYESATLSETQVAFIINFLSSSRALSYVVSEASPQIIDSYGFNEHAVNFTIYTSDHTSKSFALSTSSFEATANYVLLKDSNTIITIPTFSIEFTSLGETLKN